MLAVIGLFVMTGFAGNAQARYVEADPIWLAGGLNLYGYAGQNPTQNTDRLGLCPPEYKGDCIDPVYPLESVIGLIVTRGASAPIQSTVGSLRTAYTLTNSAPANANSTAAVVEEQALAKSTPEPTTGGSCKITPEQQANLDRFTGKLPANARDSVTVQQLPNGGVAAQGTSPGQVPGSSAVYEKQIDANGQTMSVTKTVYDPAGNIVSVKDK